MEDLLFRDLVYFHQLLVGEKLVLSRERFNKFKLNSVLDIGCGEGGALMRMYYAFGTLNVEGFYVMSEQDTLQAAIKRKTEKNLRSSPDKQRIVPRCIEDVYGLVRRYPDDVLPRMESVEEVRYFMKNIQYSTIASGYEPRLKSHDAVICSQVIQHARSVSDATEVLEMIRLQVNEGSLVFIAIKDGFPTALGYLEPSLLLAICSQYMSVLGLQHYLGKQTKDQGRVHIYTNL